MQVNINGMTIEIQKTYYNKSKVQEDGITHIIDTEHNYPVYQFGMAKTERREYVNVGEYVL